MVLRGVAKLVFCDTYRQREVSKPNPGKRFCLEDGDVASSLCQAVGEIVSSIFHGMVLVTKCGNGGSLPH